MWGFSRTTRRIGTRARLGAFRDQRRRPGGKRFVSAVVTAALLASALLPASSALAASSQLVTSPTVAPARSSHVVPSPTVAAAPVAAPAALPPTTCGLAGCAVTVAAFAPAFPD